MAALSVMSTTLEGLERALVEIQGFTLIALQAELAAPLALVAVFAEIADSFPLPDVLSVLHARLARRNEPVVLRVFLAALLPTLESVGRWMRLGQLDSPFFVQKSFDSFHLHGVPAFLCGFGDKILVTGATMHALGTTALGRGMARALTAAGEEDLSPCAVLAKLGPRVEGDSLPPPSLGGSAFYCPLMVELEQALAAWIAALSRHASRRLRPALADMQFLPAFHLILDTHLLRTDGMAHFAVEVFERLESLEIHADPNLAGNLFRLHHRQQHEHCDSATGTQEGHDALELRFHFEEHSLYITKSIPDLFAAAVVEYHQPWPFDLLCRNTKPLLDELFSFLMRFKYARYCLVRCFQLARPGERQVAVMLHRIKALLQCLEYYLWDCVSGGRRRMSEW
jgi:hypothetical protein